MKNEFYGYYPPSPDEYGTLWKNATVVLDTNVLLDLYRLPETARRDFLSVLQQVKDRLWIPYHVALEFQLKRMDVISDGRKAVENTLSETKQKVLAIRRSIEQLELDKRSLGIDAEALLMELDEASAKIAEAVSKAHGAQLDISADDPIRTELDALFDGRVGLGPNTQAEVDSLCAEGEQRYKDKIPPGFKDADKAKNPNDAEFRFDGLRYSRAYGDLIIWRQLLAKAPDFNSILLITSDRKDDWWWRESGKTLGPHPALLREMRRTVPGKPFWLYTSDNFLQLARTYLDAKIEDKSVADVKQVAKERSHQQDVQSWSKAAHARFQTSPSSFSIASSAAIDAVEKWIVNDTKEVTTRIGPQTLTFERTDFVAIVHVVGGTTLADIPKMITESANLAFLYSRPPVNETGKEQKPYCVFAFHGDNIETDLYKEVLQAKIREKGPLVNIPNVLVGSITNGAFTYHFNITENPPSTIN